MKFLQLVEIIEINRRMVLTYGGFFVEGDDNVANIGSLEYILEMIRGSSYYGLYPTLIEKAAALAWRIITTHIFHDGNHRTGIEACRLMLDLNGYTMRIDMDVPDVARQISQGQISFSNFVQWLEARITER